MTKKPEPVNDLPRLSAPAHRALAGMNIATLKDVSLHTEKEIATLHVMGPTGIKELREALAEKGLSFKA
jgi:hypothetical protein